MTSDKSVRLVITGHDAANQGGVRSDERVGPRGPAADGWQAFLLYGADTLPRFPDDGTPQTLTVSSPGPGAIRFVQLVVYPEGTETAGAEGSWDMSRSKIQRSADGDGMHYTPSLDLVVVLEGEVVLKLDTEESVLREGDFLVQNGTRHAWVNRSDSPARLGVFVVGTEHAGF